MNVHGWTRWALMISVPLTPLIYGHINPYGTFRLNMSERITIEEVAAA